MLDNNKIFKNHVLPNFLCIGVMRSGTTWLYEVLKTHPEIYITPYIKEINFFTDHYSKGLNWYKNFFPRIKNCNNYKAIGDINQRYICYDFVPERVLKYLPKARFIIIIRNPVDRAFSDYKLFKINEGINYSFKEYLKTSDCFNRSLYAQQIKNWLKFFPRNSLLILIFENVMNNPLNALKKISKFLNIDSKKFNPQIWKKRINASLFPRFHKFYLLILKFHGYLLKKNLFKLTGILSKFKPYYLFRKKKIRENKEKIDPVIKNQLYFKYKEEIEELEKILNRDLSIWKK